MKNKVEEKQCECCGEINDTRGNFCSDDCEAAYFTNFGDKPTKPKTIRQVIRYDTEPNGDRYVAE